MRDLDWVKQTMKTVLVLILLAATCYPQDPSPTDCPARTCSVPRDFLHRFLLLVPSGDCHLNVKVENSDDGGYTCSFDFGSCFNTDL